MPHPIRFGAIEVRPAARQILVDGAPAALGARAFDLLLALIERRERLVGKHELLEAVWPGVVVEEGNLPVQVSALRKLLGPAVIATVPGRGYRFVAALDGAEDAPPDAAVDAPRAAPGPPALGNLSSRQSALFGRQAELGTVQARLASERLVTIVGAAGMGKTTLALAAAQAQATAAGDRWRDGVWWVELAPVAEPALLVHAVAQALHTALPAEAGEATAPEHLVGVLRSMKLLLVLDNCEHLVDAAGAPAERFLHQAVGVHVLATSQELLNVPGESLIKLAPLAVPAKDEAPAHASRSGAMLLFAARARAADPRFGLTPDNAAAVADICRRLDGMPLAIELAAARVHLLGVQGLRSRLGERFRVLTGGARTAMRRHQTLQAAIDWSYGLLSAVEQRVLRRLGVFVGGFSLELAQSLAQALAQDDSAQPALDEWAVLDALGALVDKSLVFADAGEPPRYRLLETTRAYALEKLAKAGETDAWIERHAHVVCNFFERAEDARFGERAVLSNLEFVQHTAPELDNARAALDWATGTPGGLNLAVGLAAAAARVMANLALSLEAIERLLALRARLDDTVHPLRAARLHLGLATLDHMGHVPLAVALDSAERAEGVFRAHDMRRRLHNALRIKAFILTTAGQWQAAQELLPAMVALEDPAWPVWRLGERLGLQGAIHLAQGQHEQALQVHTEQRALLLGAPGERRGLMSAEVRLCTALSLLGRHEECVALARSALARDGGQPTSNMSYLHLRLMTAQADSDGVNDAWQTLLQAMPGWRRNGLVFWASSAIAALLTRQQRWGDAARVGASALALQRRSLRLAHPAVQRTNDQWQSQLAAAPCDAEERAHWQREGEALDEAAIEAICLRAVEDKKLNPSPYQSWSTKSSQRSDHERSRGLRRQDPTV